MFASDKDAAAKANGIADWLSNHANFLSHGRYISRERAKDHGLVIEDLEADQRFQDLVLSVFHATMLTLAAVPYPKIIENHEGTFFITPDPVSPSLAVQSP